MLKRLVRPVLVRSLPMSLYWSLWHVRRGHLSDPIPARSDGDERLLEILPDSSYLGGLLREYPVQTDGWPRQFEHNPTFEAGDADTYHAMIRKHRPRIVIEIGVGYSSHVAAHALHGLGQGDLYLVDPDPRCPVPSSARFLRTRVENVPLDLFDRLRENDILFVDSSHTAEEFQYHCTRILPRLRAGVLIHYHDVMAPYKPRHQEEAYVLEYLRKHNDDYKPLVGLAKAWANRNLQGLVPEYRLSRCRIPSSLWIRKLSGPQQTG